MDIKKSGFNGKSVIHILQNTKMSIDGYETLLSNEKKLKKAIKLETSSFLEKVCGSPNGEPVMLYNL
ncbi:hypothetical protein GCM10020331_074040 [Ectobacillus funiculus]